MPGLESRVEQQFASLGLPVAVELPGGRRLGAADPRLLIRLLPVIADAEDKAREAEPEAEQVHFTHLNRAFDKVSTYTDIPAPIVALEYLRYRASRKRRES